MKSISIVLSLMLVLVLSTGAFSANKDAISKNVDGIAAGIDQGQATSEFKANDYSPYVFVMEELGKLLVHPSLTGESLKDKAAPVYEALQQATPDGVWVDYEWKGKMKHTYAKKTKSGLIVGSGYSE